MSAGPTNSETGLSRLGCVLLALGVAGALSLKWVLPFLIPFGGDPVIVQSPGALTVAEARQKYPLDYPESAHDIRFARYSQWIAVDEFVRFEAPLDDCIAFVERTVAEHNAEHPDRPVSGLSPIQQVDDCAEISSSKELATDWFDLCSLRKGFTAGSGGSHTPQLWIDSDRGVVYYRYTD